MAPSTSEKHSSKRKRDLDSTSAAASPRKEKKDKSHSGDKGKEREHGRSKHKNQELKEGETMLRVPSSAAEKLGPVLAAFPDYTPASQTPFKLYRAPMPGSATEDEGTLRDRLLLAGETDTMEYVSGNWDAGPGSSQELRRERRGYAGDYMLGVYDPATSSVTLRAVPLFTVSRRIKALANLRESASSAGGDWEARVQARRELGEAFGNRKARLAVRNQDRMKVDTRNMEGIQDAITDGIDDATAQLPTADAVQASADESRPIPPPNMSASHPSEAYPLHVLIIPSVQRALYIKPLLAASDNGARARTLPSPGPAQSTWLTARLSEACARVNNAAPGGLAQGKEMARTRVKVLLYIAQLWAFRRNGRNLADRAQLSEKMHLNGGQGEQVLEDLISRFSETPRGSNRPQLTTFSETKLLSYMFALCLYIDDYALDAGALAQDLSMSPQKVSEIFKSLGCTTSNVTQHTVEGGQERSRTLKRTVLKTPLSFPKPKRGVVKR